MDCSLLEHISRFIGETVTIFTTSGGTSGCGFTGVLFGVNSCFVRLVIKFGTPPASPLSESICDTETNGNPMGLLSRRKKHEPDGFEVGSICDIPVDKIASFCHNSV